MPIVDAQVHLWGSGTPLPPHRSTSVFSEDERFPRSGELALEAARQHPGRRAILGKLPRESPESRALLG